MNFNDGRNFVLGGIDNEDSTDQQNAQEQIQMEDEVMINSAAALRRRIENTHMKLVLTLHAEQCLNREMEGNIEAINCSVPNCRMMKNVLNHTKNCHVEQNCLVPQCSESKKIILNWRKKLYCSVRLPGTKKVNTESNCNLPDDKSQTKMADFSLENPVEESKDSLNLSSHQELESEPIRTDCVFQENGTKSNIMNFSLEKQSGLIGFSEETKSAAKEIDLESNVADFLQNYCSRMQYNPGSKVMDFEPEKYYSELNTANYEMRGYNSATKKMDLGISMADVLQNYYSRMQHNQRPKVMDFGTERCYSESNMTDFGIGYNLGSRMKDFVMKDHLESKMKDFVMKNHSESRMRDFEDSTLPDLSNFTPTLTQFLDNSEQFRNSFGQIDFNRKDLAAMQINGFNWSENRLGSLNNIPKIDHFSPALFRTTQSCSVYTNQPSCTIPTPFYSVETQLRILYQIFCLQNGQVQNYDQLVGVNYLKEEKRIRREMNQRQLGTQKHQHRRRDWILILSELSAFSAEDIQTAQTCIIIFIHSDNCRVNCSLPHCEQMKKVIKHLRECTANLRCSRPHCSLTRVVFRHWKQCVDTECPMCIPLKQSGVNYITPSSILESAL